MNQKHVQKLEVLNKQILYDMVVGKKNLFCNLLFLFCILMIMMQRPFF